MKDLVTDAPQREVSFHVNIIRRPKCVRGGSGKQRWLDLLRRLLCSPPMWDLISDLRP